MYLNVKARRFDAVSNRGVASVLIPCHAALGLMDGEGNVKVRTRAEGAADVMDSSRSG